MIKNHFLLKVFCGLCLLSITSQAQLVVGGDKFLGNILPSNWSVQGSIILDDFGDYWSQVTPENAGKWGVVEGSRDNYSSADLDAIYEYSRQNNIPFRQHVMVWGSQQPEWLQSLSPQEQVEEVEEWFDFIAQNYPDAEIVEVINEQLPGHSPQIHYLNAIGGTNNGAENAFLAENIDRYGPYETGWDYVIWAFAKARQYFPNAKLHINDYNVINSTENMNQYIQIIKILKERDLIDAVGLQCHYFSVDNMSGSVVTERLNHIHDQTDLPIYITELDITGSPNEQSSEDDEDIQAQRYAELFPSFWEHPAVEGVTIWGYRAGLNWVEDRGHGTSCLIRQDGTEKPAMTWLKEYLANEGDGKLAINVGTEGEGTVVQDPAESRLDSGASVTLTAEPAQGWEFVSWSGIDTNNQENPLTLTMDSRISITANFAQIVDPDDSNFNLVENGDFSAGLDPWVLNAHEDSDASGNATNGEYSVTINTLGTNPWDIQLVQRNIPLIQGRSYLLTFEASAQEERPIGIVVQMPDDPWTSYATGDIELTTSKESYTFEFDMEAETDMDSRLGFNFGDATPGVTISNIRLTYARSSNVSKKSSSVISKASGLTIASLTKNLVKVSFRAQNSGETMLKIYNLQGDAIETVKMQTVSGKKYSHTIDSRNFPKGYYVVNVSNNGTVMKSGMVVFR